VRGGATRGVAANAEAGGDGRRADRDRVPGIRQGGVGEDPRDPRRETRTAEYPMTTASRIEVVDGETVVPISLEAIVLGVLSIVPEKLTGAVMQTALKAQVALDDPERKIQISVNRIHKPGAEP
jgi:hypothetical protein